MSIQSKLLAPHLWLKTASAGRQVVAVRLKHTAADPLKDVLPQNWSELGEQIGKQLLASGSVHIKNRGASLSESVAKRGMEMDIDIDRLVRI